MYKGACAFLFVYCPIILSMLWMYVQNQEFGDTHLLNMINSTAILIGFTLFGFNL